MAALNLKVMKTSRPVTSLKYVFVLTPIPPFLCVILTNQPNVFGLWEKSHTDTGITSDHSERPQWESRPGPSCCEATVVMLLNNVPQ